MLKQLDRVQAQLESERARANALEDKLSATPQSFAPNIVKRLMSLQSALVESCDSWLGAIRCPDWRGFASAELEYLQSICDSIKCAVEANGAPVGAKLTYPQDSQHPTAPKSDLVRSLHYLG